MNFIKKNWILVLILIIVIFIIYKYYNKTKQQSINGQTQTSVFQGTINSIIPKNVISSPSENVVIKNDGFKFGDKLYANQNAVNIYKSALASPSNLDVYRSFSKDELIGTYLSTEGLFTKILIASPAHVVYAFSNQIYSK